MLRTLVTITALAAPIFAQDVYLRATDVISGVVTERTEEFVTLRVQNGVIWLRPEHIQRETPNDLTLEILQQRAIEDAPRLAALDELRRQRQAVEREYLRQRRATAQARLDRLELARRALRQPLFISNQRRGIVSIRRVDRFNPVIGITR